MAVRIRMKRLGRRHRPFYRICVMDARVPRDGKAIEEVGTYDPMVREKPGEVGPRRRADRQHHPLRLDRRVGRRGLAQPSASPPFRIPEWRHGRLRTTAGPLWLSKS